MITLKDVTKHYNDFTLSLSMDIKEGAISAFVGTNGAGKTTTFKAILDLIKIDSGSIKIFDKDHDKLDRSDKEKIGVVLADATFSKELKINDVIIILETMYHDFDGTFFRQKASDLNLPLDKKLKEFSTGMLVRFKVLCAISHHPKLLLLDEPTAGLDVLARTEILDLLRDHMLKYPDATIIISSHIASDLEAIADDIYLIDDGNIVLHEDLDKVIDDYAIIKVDEDGYRDIDKTYILKIFKDNGVYHLLTDQRNFYIENYPDVVIEKGDIDKLLTMYAKGE